MESEKRAILRALETTDDNRSEAARILGISRRAFYDKLVEVHGLNEVGRSHTQTDVDTRK